MTLFYLSFAAIDRFLGATVICAEDAPRALEQATLRGINPGGEVAILEVPKGSEAEAGKMLNRLVEREELMAGGAKKHGDLSKREKARMEAATTKVCDECNTME